MARTIRVLYDSARAAQGGGGFSTSGGPKQNKQEVRGRIVVTSYTRGGEVLAPHDLGLEKVDYLHLSVLLV